MNLLDVVFAVVVVVVDFVFEFLLQSCELGAGLLLTASNAAVILS